MKPLGRIIGAAQRGQDILDQATPAPSGTSMLRGWFRRLELNFVSKLLKDGEVVEQTRAEYILGIILPGGKRDLEMMPEGQRSWNFRVLWTDTPLTVAPDDKLIWNGSPYRVLKTPVSGEYGASKYLLINDYQ